MKCVKCDKETDEIVWVKRMVIFTMVQPEPEELDRFTGNDKMGIAGIGVSKEQMQNSLEALIEYSRLELIKIVREDYDKKKFEGESYYCKDCFTEI